MANSTKLVIWWEALIIALAPVLLILAIVLQVFHAGFWFTVIPFMMLPIAFGVALIFVDLVRNRWLSRRG